MIAAFVYFLVVMFAMGFATWRLLGIEEADDGSKFFLWLATGIVVFMMASTVLGAIGQANWFVYLLLAAILLAAAYWKDSKAGVRYSLRLPMLDLGWVLVCIIFLVYFYVFASGAYAYPWLEDDDPWDHAASTTYVSVFSSYLQPANLPLHYLAPYTPFYDVLMGVLFQLDHSSLQFILKFFNAFLVSLAIPLFFCWAKERFGSRTALWATFALAVLPCFMSHFIWAETLAIMLIFPALYFMERFSKEAEEGKKKAFGALAAFSIAAVFMTEPFVAVVFGGFMVAYIIALALPDLIESRTLNLRKLKQPVIVLGTGVLISVLLFWGPMMVLYTPAGLLNHIGFTTSFVTTTTADTGGGLVYGISDFVNAPTASKIDQPTGFGPAMALLLVIGVIAAIYALRSQDKVPSSEGCSTHDNAAIMLLWVIYGFVGTEGNLLPLHLIFPHRFWVFLAIPVAILSGYGVVKLLEWTEKNRKGMETILKVVIVAALLYTSAYPKAVVQTAQWPPGATWASDTQLAGYINLENNLPANTAVFSFCMNDEFAEGVDLAGYPWVEEVNDYKIQSINDSVDGNYAFLKKYGYEYAVIDQSCLKTLSANQVNAKLTALSTDSRFTLVSQLSGQAFITFKVN